MRRRRYSLSNAEREMSVLEQLPFFILYFGNTGGQFHQRSTYSFYVHKLQAQLFCAYILGLYFTGARLLAQKLHVER
jgi:hypothetical protein